MEDRARGRRRPRWAVWVRRPPMTRRLSCSTWSHSIVISSRLSTSIQVGGELPTGIQSPYSRHVESVSFHSPPSQPCTYHPSSSDVGSPLVSCFMEIMSPSLSLSLYRRLEKKVLHTCQLQAKPKYKQTSRSIHTYSPSLALQHLDGATRPTLIEQLDPECWSRGSQGMRLLLRFSTVRACSVWVFDDAFFPERQHPQSHARGHR
jgi:hypothetical protein